MAAMRLLIPDLSGSNHQLGASKELLEGKGWCKGYALKAYSNLAGDATYLDTKSLTVVNTH